MATAVQVAASMLTAQGAGEDAVSIIVLHEFVITLAFARFKASAVTTVLANGTTDYFATPLHRTVTRTTDLD